MGTIILGGDSYAIMGTLAGAKTYLAMGVGAGPDAFNALATDDLKGKVLVAGTRYLYRQSWQGTPTVTGQQVAFPRDGVIGPEGVIPDGTTPINLINAEYEMAALLAADASINTAVDSGSNIQSLTAGPVAISYFRATIGIDAGATKMPQVIMDLVQGYLANAQSDAVARAYGFDGSTCACGRSCSSFDECAQYSRSGPII